MLVEADPLLRRLERTAAAACLVMTALAVAIGRGRLGPAAGVIGGGLLIWISYRTIGAGVSAFVNLLTASSGAARPRLGRTMAAVVGRYALLAFLAYVMIARLRLHPLGLLAGASSVVAAAAVEALRLIVKKS